MKDIQNVEQGRRVLATVEYRKLSGNKREQLTKFVGSYSCTQRLMAEIFGMSLASVHRHVAAISAKRAPGKNGRPTALTPGQESRVFAATAERAGRKRSLSPAEVRHEVS